MIVLYDFIALMVMCGIWGFEYWIEEKLVDKGWLLTSIGVFLITIIGSFFTAVGFYIKDAEINDVSLQTTGWIVIVGSIIVTITALLLLLLLNTEKWLNFKDAKIKLRKKEVENYKKIAMDILKQGKIDDIKKLNFTIKVLQDINFGDSISFDLVRQLKYLKKKQEKLLK